MTDEALLQRFATKADHDAFAQLTLRHMDWVYASARRTLGDAHLAEDATQAVFLLLSRKAAGMSPSVRVTGWLFNAMRFVCRDIVKTRRRREMHEAKAVMTTAAPDDLSAVVPLVDDAVARLGEADRMAVLLRFHRGMEYGQIAGEMRSTPEGVRKRVDRALARMRTYLASRGGELPDRFEESLARQMACAAPAGLASAIATTISGSASPAVNALAARAVSLLRWAKIKVITALSAATLASAGVAAGVVAAQTGSSHAPAVVAVPTTAPIPPDLGTLLTSQKLQADRRTAVVATITGIIGPDIVQRLQDATADAAGAVGTGRVRLGSAEQIHGILREECMADSIKGLSDRAYLSSSFYTEFGPTPLSDQAQAPYSTRAGQGYWFIFTNGNLRGSEGGGKLSLAVDFRPEIRIDPPGMPSQPYKPAGAMNVGFTCDAGQTAVVITPIVVTADLELYAMAVVETIPCDQADEAALRYYHMSPMKDWLNEPIAKKLLRSRQIALWRGAFDGRIEDPRWSWQLPGGATVKLRTLGRNDLHPLLRFGPDGAPASAIIGGMSEWKGGVEIELTDPHGKDDYPQHRDTHESPLPDAAMIGATGSLQVGVGDGEYKKIGELRLEKGATITVDGVTYRMIEPPHDGVLPRLDYTMRRDLNVTFALVDGTGQRRFEERPAAVITGEQPDKWRLKDYYVQAYAGFKPSALEIWARPRLWHTFEGFAVRPSKPVPSEAEAYASMIKGELPKLDKAPSSASVPATMLAWTPRNVWTRVESPTSRTNQFLTADLRYYIGVQGQNASRYAVFDGKECRTWDDSRQLLRVSKWQSDGLDTFQRTVRQLASLEMEMKLVDPKPVDLGNGEAGREFIFTLQHGGQTGRARLDAKGRPRLFATSDGAQAQYIEYDLADDSRWFAVNRDSFAKVIDDDRADALCASLTPAVPVDGWRQHLGRKIAIHDAHRSENGMVLLCVTTMLDGKTVQAIPKSQRLVGWTRGQLLTGEYPAYKAVPLLAIDAPERSTRWYALVPGDAKEPLDLRALRLDLSFRSIATNWEDCDRAIAKAANAEGPALVFLKLPPVPEEVVPLDTWLKDAASAMLNYREQTAGLAGNTWPYGGKTADEVIGQCRKAIAESPHSTTYWP